MAKLGLNRLEIPKTGVEMDINGLKQVRNRKVSYKIYQKSSKLGEMCLKGQNWVRNGQNGLKWVRSVLNWVRNVLRWLKMRKIGKKGQKWSKMDKIWLELSKNGLKQVRSLQNWVKMS